MRRIYLNSIILTSVLFTSSCSSLGGKFESTEHVNLEPFSENVSVMASQLSYGFDKVRSVHSRWYFDLNSIELKRLLNLEKLVNNEIYFIVKYSNRIVFLSESNIPITQKTSEIARYINKMYSHYANSKTLAISEQQKEIIITEIKKQQEFLSALRAAQPFIRELSRYGNRLLDQLKKAERELGFFQNKKIESENGHLKTLMLSLAKNEQDISNAIVLLNDYEAGTKKTLKTLKQSRILQEQSLIQSKKSLSKNQVALLKKYLLNKLTENTKYFRQIEPSYNRYILAQKELSNLIVEHDAEIRKSRMIFITFASAHRKMASGITKPAEWFNIKESPKMLLNLLPY